MSAKAERVAERVFDFGAARMIRVLAGEIVSFFLDRPAPFPGSYAVETAVGTLYISANIIKAAAFANLPVVYGETDLLPNGEVQLSFYRLPSSGADEMLEEFARRIQAKVERAPFRI